MMELLVFVALKMIVIIPWWTPVEWNFSSPHVEWPESFLPSHSPPGVFLQTDSAPDQTWQPLTPAEFNWLLSLNGFMLQSRRYFLDFHVSCFYKFYTLQGCNEGLKSQRIFSFKCNGTNRWLKRLVLFFKKYTFFFLKNKYFFKTVKKLKRDA